MFSLKSFATVVLATTILSSAAFSADLNVPTVKRAVSAPNGKIEIGGGFGAINTIPTSAEFYGAASFSMPLGDMFGFQADLADLNSLNQNKFGGAGHLFARDPDSYLLGAYGGVVNYGGGTASFIGPEVELYADNVSFEAAGGFMNLAPVSAPSVGKAFVFADVGFYATDNLRFTLGASSVADFKSAHLGAEWLMNDSGLPISLKTNAQIGDSGYYSVTAGISFYFGGEDKSLIRRHREDDPHNRLLDIFGSGLGNNTTPPAPICYDSESNVVPCKIAS